MDLGTYKLTLQQLKEDAKGLIERARAGDHECRPDLREFLDANPQLWQQLADLPHHVEEAVLKSVAPIDFLQQDAYRRKLSEMKTSLTEEDDSPLARLLIERAAISWLWISSLESILSRSRELTKSKRKDVELQLNRAERRYHSAIKSLAHLRRLENRPSQGERERANPRLCNKRLVE